MTVEYLNNKEFEYNIIGFKKIKQDKCKYELILEDITESYNRFKNPVRKELLERKQQEYRKVLLDHHVLENKLATSFLTLSENIIRYRKFHFVDSDDAIQEFVLTCFEKIDRFNVLKGKAFSFFSTIILNCYRQMYRSARNYNELKTKYKDHLSTEPVKNKKNKIIHS